ncbi:hypothetical protein GOV03_01100 [Candidatus Woesearchaeota archaeon]|nr:hypothetical protein [Candidatus Woesearchaeota archaeon]
MEEISDTLCGMLVKITHSDSLKLNTRWKGKGGREHVIELSYRNEKLFQLNLTEKELFFWNAPRCNDTQKSCQELANYLRERDYLITCEDYILDYKDKKGE